MNKTEVPIPENVAKVVVPLMPPAAGQLVRDSSMTAHVRPENGFNEMLKQMPKQVGLL